MRRPLLLTATTIATTITILTLTTHAGASTICADSFPDDGYNGPHWNSTSGGTMSGNTLRVDCPTQSTPYDFTYMVQRQQPGAAWTVVFSIHKTGQGSIQTSFSANPVGCDPNSVYRTRVKNNATSNAINKPLSGLHLNC